MRLDLLKHSIAIARYTSLRAPIYVVITCNSDYPEPVIGEESYSTFVLNEGKHVTG